MLNVIKMNLYRMLHSKVFLFMPLIVTPIIIFCAMYFSSNVIANPTIGVFSNNHIDLSHIKNVNIVSVDEKVPLSDLVKNKFDAVVYFQDDGFTVDTIKGTDYKERVERLFSGEDITLKSEVKRGTGANIMGYLSMFILFMGYQLYKFYFDDKKFISKRVISCGMSYEEYLASHAVAVLIMLFVPTSIVTILLKEILNIDTSITALEFLFIIFLLCFLSASFGLLMCSITDNDITAGMLTNIIVTASTLLSGSFFTVSNNKLMNILGNILPQKHLLNFAINLENNNSINTISLLDVVLVSIILMVISFAINKYRMKVKNCM